MHLGGSLEYRFASAPSREIMSDLVRVLCNTSRICGGLCRHGILVVVLLYIVEAKVLVAGYLLMGFLYLWGHIVAEATG
jgi:hypothetical protein